MHMFHVLSAINHHITRTKADILTEKSIVHYVNNASEGLMKLNSILLLRTTGLKPSSVVICGRETGGGPHNWYSFAKDNE